MKNAQLLSTVAAALLITVSAASAQIKEQTPPERAPAAQQKAPAEKVAPPMNAGQMKGPETTGQAAPTPMSPGKNDAAKPGAAANSPSGKDAADIKARSDSNMAPNKAAADKAAQDKSGQNEPGAAPSTAQTNPTKSTTTTTTGQGAAGASARLSPEQRTKITAVFKTQKVAKVEPAKLNVSISVGTRVPSTLRFYPVPQEVVVIYPEWRGYDYIMVGNQIIILQPGTHEIVAILDA